MFCRYCGVKLLGDVKYCHDCGKDLSKEKSYICRHCNAPTNPNYRYCENCGFLLDEINEVNDQIKKVESNDMEGSPSQIVNDHKAAESSEPSKEQPVNYPKQDVSEVVILSIVTFGIYGLVWLWKRNKLINKTGIDLEIVVSTIALFFALSWILFFVSLAYDEYDDGYVYIVAFRLIFQICAYVFYLFAIFTIRSCMNDELKNRQQPQSVSGIWTFILSIYYLQYKMNRM